MKRVVLVSSYCNTEEKVDILIENLRKLKSLNLDVFLFTPIILENKIYDLCDLVIISKENPVFDWPKKAYSRWTSFKINNKLIKMTTTYPDYGYANLNQFKRLGEIAINMNYDHFFPLIYDVEIDQDIENILLNETNSSFYSSGRDNEVWEIGLHLMSFDRKNMIIFNDLITEEQYLENLNEEAFSFIYRNLHRFEASKQKKVVYDKIDIQNRNVLYNNSIIEGVNCFIHKNDYDDFIKIIFYGLNEPEEIEIEIDDHKKSYVIEDWNEIQINNKNFSNLIVKYREKNYDFTEVVLNIKNNFLEIIDNY